MKKTPQELERENIDTFMEIGPRLSRRYNIFVVGRDRSQQMALLGGLGSMGVGRMWFYEVGREDYPGFNDAPEIPYKGDQFRRNVDAESEMLKKREIQ